MSVASLVLDGVRGRIRGWSRWIWSSSRWRSTRFPRRSGTGGNRGAVTHSTRSPSPSRPASPSRWLVVDGGRDPRRLGVALTWSFVTGRLSRPGLLGEAGPSRPCRTGSGRSSSFPRASSLASGPPGMADRAGSQRSRLLLRRRQRVVARPTDCVKCGTGATSWQDPSPTWPRATSRLAGVARRRIDRVRVQTLGLGLWTGEGVVVRVGFGRYVPLERIILRLAFAVSQDRRRKGDALPS